jgi:ATP-binding cassette subfamily C (CFTR/MRP) protein 4
MVEEEPSKYDEAFCFSKVFGCWLASDAIYAASKSQTSADLIPIPKFCADNSSRLNHYWEQETKKPSPCLFRAIAKTFGCRFLLGVLMFILGLACQLANAELQARIINFMGDQRVSIEIGLAFALGLFLSSVIGSLCNDFGTFYLNALSIGMKMTCLHQLYTKVQRLNLLADEKTGGKVVNIATTDLDNFNDIYRAAYLIVTPLMWVGAGVMLWFKIGVAGLVGLSAILAYAAILSEVQRAQGPIKAKQSGIADERMRLLTNLVEGIKVIKMYSWESAFFKLIFHRRSQEIALECKSSVLMSCTFAMFTCGFASICLATFAVHKALGNDLVLADVFAVICILQVVHYYTCWMFTLGLFNLYFILIGTKRLSDVLLAEEVVKRTEEAPSNQSVEFINVDVSWGKEAETNLSSESLMSPEEFKLSNLNLNVVAGQLCLVVGAVGSGKSSLLMSLMGELYTTRGEIKTSGTLAYVEQEPWILSATVCENIIMDKEFNEPFYRQVLDVCCLQDDIALMDFNDQTVVGERGVTLSGGQKARLVLARAVYADRDIYLLDGPLSAVDLRVSATLFDKCITDLLQHKTRILVTHQLQYLSST